MTAYVIDGKAIAAKVRADVAADVARSSRSTALRPGSRWCSSARTRRARSTCATRPSRPSRSACSPSSTSCAEDTPEQALLDLVAKLNRRPERARHPRAAAAAQAHRQREGAGSDRPGQGRRRLPPDERRPARRSASARWRRARRSARSSWPSRCSTICRASTPSSSAAPTSSASRWRSCCCARTAR